MNAEQYIIYGVGEQGKGFFDFLTSKGLNSYIHAFCDRNSDKIVQIGEKQVYSYQKAKELALTFIICVADEKAKKEIVQMMDKDKIRYCAIDELAELAHTDRVSFNREYCAYYHIKSMDLYFKNAESEEALDIFWNNKSPFYTFFQKLDISNVIELACGRGRHVLQYIDGARQITLVDILEQNIEFCKERLKEYHNISYYCNIRLLLEMLRMAETL